VCVGGKGVPRLPPPHLGAGAWHRGGREPGGVNLHQGHVPYKQRIQEAWGSGNHEMRYRENERYYTAENRGII